MAPLSRIPIYGTRYNVHLGDMVGIIAIIRLSLLITPLQTEDISFIFTVTYLALLIIPGVG
jgi:hypothetical protein